MCIQYVQYLHVKIFININGPKLLTLKFIYEGTETHTAVSLV